MRCLLFPTLNSITEWKVYSWLKLYLVNVYETKFHVKKKPLESQIVRNVLERSFLMNFFLWKEPIFKCFSFLKRKAKITLENRKIFDALINLFIQCYKKEAILYLIKILQMFCKEFSTIKIIPNYWIWTHIYKIFEHTH